MSPDFTQNHFELFALPVSYDLDTQALDQAYRGLLREVHPDRFAGTSDAEKRLAAQWATRANEGYQTLKSPLKRGRYFLRINGIDTEEESNTAMPVDFLLQQMEWREAVVDAKSARDEARLDGIVVRHQLSLASADEAPAAGQLKAEVTERLANRPAFAGDATLIVRGRVVAQADCLAPQVFAPSGTWYEDFPIQPKAVAIKPDGRRIFLLTHEEGIQLRDFLADPERELSGTELGRIADPYTAMSLRLQAAFGLRREESIKIRPEWADRGNILALKDTWTKGGRPREIPIRNAEQRQVLDEAKALAGRGSLIPAERSYVEQLRRFEYQCAAAGAHRIHGHRHQYAQTRYRELTGWPAPAAGSAGSRACGDHSRDGCMSKSPASRSLA